MSQFRKHFRPTWKDRLSTWRAARSGVIMQKGAIVQAGAAIERFPAGAQIGRDVVIKSHAQICPCNADARITIGDETTVGFYTFIFASEAISIGRQCMIAPFVYIVDSNHGIARDTPMAEQANTSAPVTIGDDVWIGAQTTILAGSKLADGCVLAANSVLSGETQPYEIWAGSPARKIGERR